MNYAKVEVRKVKFAIAAKRDAVLAKWEFDMANLLARAQVKCSFIPSRRTPERARAYIADSFVLRMTEIKIDDRRTTAIKRLDELTVMTDHTCDEIIQLDGPTFNFLWG